MLLVRTHDILQHRNVATSPVATRSRVE